MSCVRTLLIVSTTLVLLSCNQSATITPDSVGNLRIGMSASQVAELKAPLTPGDMAETCVQRPLKLQPLLLMFDKGMLVRIDITHGDYKTAEGIHIGSSEQDAKAAYGDRLSVQPHKYVENAHYLNVIKNDAGYVFETDGKTVTRIRVGKMPSLSYVEGCL